MPPIIKKAKVKIRLLNIQEIPSPGTTCIVNDEKGRVAWACLVGIVNGQPTVIHSMKIATMPLVKKARGGR